MLSRLHMDSYINAKLAISNLDLKHNKKVNELKSWIKEIQPSINKIECIEKYLNTDLDSESFKKCKNLCKDLKDFNKITVDVLYAKILWKVGKYESALKKLYSVSSISTVKMNPYFVLLDFLKFQNNTKCMKTVAYEMLIKCKSSQVPSSVWMKVNIIYAKMLVKTKKPGKALLLLKSLAKLISPFPFADIQYTKLLQRAKTMHDLTEAHTKVIDSYNAYTFSTYKNSFIDSDTQTREFSKKIVDEDDDIKLDRNPKKYYKRRESRLATERIDNQLLYPGKYIPPIESKKKIIDAKSAILDTVNIDSTDTMSFSICSDPIFLYQIAKISYKYGISQNDSLCAIKDFIELLKYEKDKAKRDDLNTKALKLFTLILEKTKSNNSS